MLVHQSRTPPSFGWPSIGSDGQDGVAERLSVSCLISVIA